MSNLLGASVGLLDRIAKSKPGCHALRGIKGACVFGVVSLHAWNPAFTTTAPARPWHSRANLWAHAGWSTIDRL